jgi:hypothetical protein
MAITIEFIDGTSLIHLSRPISSALHPETGSLLIPPFRVGLTKQPGAMSLVDNESRV